MNRPTFAENKTSNDRPALRHRNTSQTVIGEFLPPRLVGVGYESGRIQFNAELSAMVAQPNRMRMRFGRETHGENNLKGLRL
jgi:hypothetical protein